MAPASSGPSANGRYPGARARAPLARLTALGADPAPAGHQQHDRCASQLDRQERHQPQRRRIGPLQIVQHDQQRPPGTRGGECGEHGLERCEQLRRPASLKARSTPSEVSTCRHGQNAGRSSSSWQRPHATAKPRRVASCAVSRARLDLPIPGSPSTRTKRRATSRQGGQHTGDLRTFTVPAEKRALRTAGFRRGLQWHRSRLSRPPGRDCTGSPRRICRCRARSATPGSRPSSSDSTILSRLIALESLGARPVSYSACISSCQQRSRSGCSATSRSRSAMVSAGPAELQQRRAPVLGAAQPGLAQSNQVWLGQPPTRQFRGGPIHPPQSQGALGCNAAASAGRPARSARPASSACRSNTATSTCSASTASRYPEPLRTRSRGAVGGVRPAAGCGAVGRCRSAPTPWDPRGRDHRPRAGRPACPPRPSGPVPTPGRPAAHAAAGGPGRGSCRPRSPRGRRGCRTARCPLRTFFRPVECTGSYAAAAAARRYTRVASGWQETGRSASSAAPDSRSCRRHPAAPDPTIRRHHMTNVSHRHDSGHRPRPATAADRPHSWWRAGTGCSGTPAPKFRDQIEAVGAHYAPDGARPRLGRCRSRRTRRTRAGPRRGPSGWCGTSGTRSSRRSANWVDRRPAVSTPSFRPDVLSADQGFVAAVLVGAAARGCRPVVLSVSPLMASSIDTAPAGLGLPPMRGPVGRLRNRMLNTMVAGSSRQFSATARRS